MWLPYFLLILCRSWPDQRDDDEKLACYMKRTLPDTYLPTTLTPLELLFVRSIRTQLGAWLRMITFNPLVRLTPYQARVYPLT